MSELSSKNDYSNQTFNELINKESCIEDKQFDCCKFIKCDFSGSSIKRCRFVECEFIDCNLSLINFMASSFSEVIFERSKMLGIDWTKVKWPQVKLTSPIEFYTCNINHSSFFGLSLGELIVENCQAHEVDFRDSDLSFSSFQGTDLHMSLFMNTNLSNANLTDAVNYNIDVNNNNLKKAKFSFPEVISLLDYLDIEITGLHET